MKKIKVIAHISGWSTVSCACDWDEDEDEEAPEDYGDYDYSAGNSGASYCKDVELEYEVPDDATKESLSEDEKFMERLKQDAFREVDSGDLDILDGEDELDDWEMEVENGE